MSWKKRRKKHRKYLCKNGHENGTRIYIKNKWSKILDPSIYIRLKKPDFYVKAGSQYDAIRKARRRSR